MYSFTRKLVAKANGFRSTAPTGISVRDSCVINDCIAVCSPGAVLTVPVLVERITLFPRSDTDEPNKTSLCTDEIYDVLLRPENNNIDRLLFVSPHVLFDLSQDGKGIDKYIFVEDITNESSDYWQYPARPTKVKDVAKITLQTSNNQPGPHNLALYEGEVARGVVKIPDGINDAEVLGFLQGLGRTVFEFIFQRPVPRGEYRWLRLHIKPPRLNAPSDVQMWRESCKCSPKADYFQLLNILGADTMLAAFKDELSNLQRATALAPQTNIGKSIPKIAPRIFDEVFGSGFERKGTYTRIEDQRIFLLPQDCRIDVKHTEGSVRFIGYPRVEIAGKFTNCFHWSAGLRDFAAQDPIAVALQIMEYVKGYATNRSTSKSKPYIAVATSVNYELGCHVIDELEAIGLLKEFNDEFYCSDKNLPNSQMEQWSCLVDLAYRIACRFTLTKAHFLILYEAEWRQ